MGIAVFLLAVAVAWCIIQIKDLRHIIDRRNNPDSFE